MGKYKALGVDLDRTYRNDLNANFDAVDTDIKAVQADVNAKNTARIGDIDAQKKRVDDLIVANPQPSEVQDARGGFAVLRDRLDDLANKTDWINVSKYATLQDAFNAVSDKGIVYFPYSGTYNLNTSFSVKNKSLTIIGNNVELGGSGTITFDSDLSTAVVANDVADGDYKVLSDVSVAVGDYIEINGTITHSLYVPYRYTTTKVIARVSAIDTSTTPDTITLDRGINFGLTTVTVSKILNPYQLNVQNLRFKNTQFAIKHCVGGNIEVSCTGSRGTGSGLSIEQSCDLKANVTTTDLLATLGLVMNDCNRFDVTLKSTRTGLFDGTGTKAFRGNGLQNGFIKGVFDSSPVADSTIYASRALTINYQTVNSGRYYRQNNITTGNRLESVQFSECDNLDVTINADKVDDQAIEFLGCYRSVIKPKINTLNGATEGAIVIKGGSQEVTILNPVIRCYNTYGIKIETTDGQGTASATNVRTNNVKIINPDIVNLLSGGYGVIVRDSPVTMNAYGEVIGGHIKAQFPVMLFDTNQNYLTVKGSIIESTGGHAIQGLGDYLTVDNVTALGCNDTTIRAIVSSGANDKVTNVVSDGCIYIRTNARTSMAIKRYLKNKVSRIFVDTDSYSIYADNGSYKVTAVPTSYTWERGQRLENQSPAVGSPKAWVCTVAGTPGTWVSEGNL